VHIYQIKIEVRQYKTDEFVKSMRSFSHRLRKQKGCLGYGVYRDIEKENTYILLGEWKTEKTMEKHFRTQDFEVLIGAARVLGDTFAMNIAEVSKTGGVEFAREHIASKQRKITKRD
jgi:quinol monooxygenase YgiN